MKSISLWEPWASLMACGAKRNETRSWPMRYRGDLVICAAKVKNPLPTELGFILLDFKEQLGLGGWVTGSGIYSKLPFGHALCIVDVYDCVQADAYEDAQTSTPENILENKLGDYSVGRFVWLTRNVRRFKTPFPFKGKQGFFDVPDELVEAALK